MNRDRTKIVCCIFFYAFALLFISSCGNEDEAAIEKVRLVLMSDNLSGFEESSTRYDDYTGWNYNDQISVFVKNNEVWSGNLKYVNKNLTDNAPASFIGDYEAKVNDKLLIRAFAPYQSNFDVNEGLLLDIHDQTNSRALNFFKAEYRLDNYNQKPYLSFKRCMARVVIDIYRPGAESRGYEYDKFRASANIISQAYVKITDDFAIAGFNPTVVYFKEENIQSLYDMRRLSLLMFPTDLIPNIDIYNTAKDPVNPILRATFPNGITRLEAGKEYKFNVWK